MSWSPLFTARHRLPHFHGNEPKDGENKWTLIEWRALAVPSDNWSGRDTKRGYSDRVRSAAIENERRKEMYEYKKEEDDEEKDERTDLVEVERELAGDGAVEPGLEIRGPVLRQDVLAAVVLLADARHAGVHVLAAVDVLDRRLAEEKVHVVPDVVRPGKVRSCQSLNNTLLAFPPIRGVYRWRHLLSSHLESYLSVLLKVNSRLPVV